MCYQTGENIHGFVIESNEEVAEIDGVALQGVHKASGARLLILKNSDRNKAFSIGFRTPPKNDTGVFHILEHSVLCGSKRFPVKEPFVELLKTSMQTFLNAMTFSDKTMYPVASTNEKDLMNLMDVYLDAVFHPNIFSKEAIFQQEGWHYELQKDTVEENAQEERLVYNGVVFNEMKGALSDPNSILYNQIQSSLFPDTCYAYESGGTPESIPQLTYEEFLNEHQRHYRADNSYIVLYGDIDIEKLLHFLDERYLSVIAQEEKKRDEDRIAQGLELHRPRTIDVQAPLTSEFIQKEMKTSPENACAAAAYVVGNIKERQKMLAINVLLDALFGSNEAPFKRTLLDMDIAHDINASIMDSSLQPFVYVSLLMPKDDTAQHLRMILKEQTLKLLEQGLDHEILEATLSRQEFIAREHDYGTSDGVINAVLALNGWLYHDDAALAYLKYEEDFAFLRKMLEEDYFEKLLKEIFCKNNHNASAEIVPVEHELHNESEVRLKNLESALSEDERKSIRTKTNILREIQEKPDSKEALETLPCLKVADIDQIESSYSYSVDDLLDAPVLYHDIPTYGIAYTRLMFDISHLSFEELPYVAIFAKMLGKLDTKHYSAAHLDTKIQKCLGNLSFFLQVDEDVHDISQITPRFVIDSSALESSIDDMVYLINEVSLNTLFTQHDKLLNVLKQEKIALEYGFINSAHLTAMIRSRSYYRPASLVRDNISNIGYYHFICDLISHFKDRAASLEATLQGFVPKIFNEKNLLVSYGGSRDSYTRFIKMLPHFDGESSAQMSFKTPALQVLNEAFIVPSDVCYASLASDMRLLKKEYHGMNMILSRALSFHYLWNEVRVKGGAYGVGFKTSRLGDLCFYSYRDPHLERTMDLFEKSSEWLSDFMPSEKDREGMIVATVSGIDAPLKPRAYIKRDINEYLCGISPHDRLLRRREVLEASEDVFSQGAELVRAVAENKTMCVVGNESIISRSSRFENPQVLIGSHK